MPKMIDPRVTTFPHSIVSRCVSIDLWDLIMGAWVQVTLMSMQCINEMMELLQ